MYFKYLEFVDTKKGVVNYTYTEAGYWTFIFVCVAPSIKNSHQLFNQICDLL